MCNSNLFRCVLKPAHTNRTCFYKDQVLIRKHVLISWFLGINLTKSIEQGDETLAPRVIVSSSDL